ncbi:Mitochondrial dynamics protein MID49 [Liparis tanakae]|uniref:Mitochondrial dynamics protein MID49 n=1 Tax=Liparis tanakae TaxID=230148 RepID=A0A4Z2IFN9_9TELE|nr:Mitochondrial dynamics protein MID49 [Liparis tanakae]
MPGVPQRKEAMNFQGGRRRGEDGIAMVIDFLLSNARLVLGVGGAAVLGIATLAVKRLIERAGRPADDDEKAKQKMSESWEELSLASASPTLTKKGIEEVVMQHVAKAARQHKADLSQPQTSSPEAPSKPESKSKRVQLCVLSLQVGARMSASALLKA